MRDRVLSIVLLAALAFVPACRSSSNASEARRAPTTAAVIPLTLPKAAEITVEQLELLLPRHPIVVGSDVDDTLYGDADGDITAAVAAGAVPIRVKRAPDSYGKDPVHNGQLGEIVLAESER